MAASLAGRSPAQLTTYLLEPKNWLIVTVLGIGGHADGLAGLGWGLLAALFTAVLPTLFIGYGIRHGRWDDRNVGARMARLIVLAFITTSVAAGLILLIVGGAPAPLTDYLALMLASVALLAVVTTVWNISIHGGRVGFGSRPRPHLRAARRLRLPACRAAGLVPGDARGPQHRPGRGRHRLGALAAGLAYAALVRATGPYRFLRQRYGPPA